VFLIYLRDNQKLNIGKVLNNLTIKFNGLCLQYKFSKCEIIKNTTGGFVKYLWCNDRQNDHDAATKARDGWQLGMNWWITANEQYLRLIGGIETVKSGTTYECNCTQYDYDGFPVSNWSYQVTDPSQCVGQGNSNFTDCSTSPTTIYDFTVVHEPNDGAVTKTSALAFPGIDLNNTQSMINSNHSQLTNDTNTRDRLKELFFGYYGNFFITTNR